jgi:hypothetical protein
MTSRQKVLWGGLGGICPVLIMLITMDLQSWISNFNIYKIVGFLIRTLVLFALGAIIANLHNENNKLKIFELGIAAPALLASLVNGFTNPENKSISLIIPRTALVLYAQDNNIDLTPKLLQLEKDNAFTQVLQGALGREAPPKNNFIVLEKCISLD